MRGGGVEIDGGGKRVSRGGGSWGGWDTKEKEWGGWGMGK